MCIRQKVYSWSRRLGTMLEIRQRSHFLSRSTSPLFTSFSKTDRTAVFSHRPLANILKYRGRWDLPTMKNKIPSDMYWRVQLVCMKVQAHSSPESPQEYNQDQMFLTNQSWLWPIANWEVTWIWCSFGLVIKGNKGKEIPNSSRREFLEKFFADSFTF